MATVISVVNQKGGVGKTTTAVNISSALANLGLKTLLIDFDPQGHSTEHLGVRESVGNLQGRSVLEVIQENQNPANCVNPSYIKNLWVMPADLRLGQFNQNSPAGKQFALKAGLTEEYKEKFDFIIIDCQPSLSLLTLNALTTCDKVLLPVQAEYFALDGLTQLIYTLKEVQTKLHPKLSVLGVLITMYDKRNKLSSEVKEELDKNFGEELFKATIPRSVKLAEAPSFGKSIFEYASNSFGAFAYREAAEELVFRIRKEIEEKNMVPETN